MIDCFITTSRVSSFLVMLLFAVSASAQRFPFVIPGDDAKETATSRTSLLEVPAGKSGFVQVKDGHFYAGKNRIRFWGVNLCFAANFPTHAEADLIAPHMAKLGINAVRFHHMDGQDAPSGVWAKELKDGKRVFDPEMIDRLDYFLDQLHRHGIYADLNMHCSRLLGPKEGYPVLDGAPWWAASNKWVMYYDQSVQDNIKQYCQDLLTHENPYRDDLKRVDDPGIALVEMLNENYFSKQGYSLYKRLPKRFQRSLIEAWNRWLVEKYSDTQTMQRVWNSRQPSVGDDLVDSGCWASDLGTWELSEGQRAMPWTLGVATTREVAAPAIRIEPQKVFEQDYHQQLSQNGLSVTKGKPYTLSYWVRADQTRPYRTEFSTQQGGEWRSLGIHESLVATAKWQQVTRVLFPSETIQSDVSLRFNFGTATAPIEFAGVSLRPGAVSRPLSKDENLKSLSVGVPDDGSPVAAHEDMRQFMVDTEIAWVDELKRFLRDDLGVKVPLMASQVNYHTSAVNEQFNDFIDLHNYWHHPMFPQGAQWSSKRWTVGNDPMETNPTVSSWPTNSLLMRTPWRYSGKPMTLTEWNYPEPSPFSSGCVPMAASLAAIQDWDAVFFFDYDSGPRGDQSWNRDQTINFFSFNGQPVKLANFSVFSNVFLRGDLAPLKREKLAPIDSPISGVHAFQYRLAVDPKAQTTPSLGDVDASDLSTPDGRLKWKSDPGKKGHLQIDTARTQGVWGTIGNQSFATSELKIDVGELDPNYATIVATSQSKSPLSKSSKIILLASTYSENQAMQWNDDRTSVGDQWGKGPTTLVGIDADVSLKNEQAGRVFVLDGTGRRMEEVDVKRDGDWIRFKLSSKQKTLWYEIAPAKKPPKPFEWVNEMPTKHPEQLVHRTFNSPLAKQNVGYMVLLPDDYSNSDKRYPVVYYLHGGRPGDETKSVTLAQRMVDLRDKHGIDPPIYVFVNGGPVSHYNVPDRIGVSGKPDAIGADVFINELIPHIDATYRTIAKRESRGLEGFSQGGRATMRLSLRYPELFSSVAAGGGGYETERKISESPESAESETLRFAKGDNTWDLARSYVARNDAPKLNLMIFVGDRGFNYENNLQYMEFLTGQGIGHKALVVPEEPHSVIGIYDKKGLEIMRFHEANFAGGH